MDNFFILGLLLIGFLLLQQLLRFFNVKCMVSGRESEHMIHWFLSLKITWIGFILYEIYIQLLLLREELEAVHNLN